ncbi:hypothetical protein ACX0G9_25665 [Flavitalea flava]
MKCITGFSLLILICQTCAAQYYYKDLVLTRQTTSQWKLYKENKVKMVTLSSLEGDGRPTEGFQAEQEVSGDFSRISTYTRSSGTTESRLIVYYSPTGAPVRTVDTSDTYKSSSEYQYDPNGWLQVITNTSLETDNQLKDVEQHLWQYDQGGKPTSMLKIKNGNDSTLVRFVRDEKGNIAEERATRKKTDLPIIYYYYDDANRLTDIVRYNAKAQRLLPETIFEYSETGNLLSMLVVPAGSNDYQKWYYEYNDKNLKAKESCFNKKKILLGRIEYSYK